MKRDVYSFEDMIQTYGDQAYHKAIEFTGTAVLLKDNQGAELFASLAKDLLQAGYHKYQRTYDGRK